MDFDHYSSSDPRSVSPGDVTSVRNYRCVTCGKSGSQFGSGAPFCEDCQAYMKEDGTISDYKVAEIKSRKTPANTTNRERGRKGRYEDGLVREMKAVVHPRSGTGDFLLTVNMDLNTFTRGLILAKWGQASFMTSVQEIGAAFTPFDPTPKKSIIERPNGKSDEVTIHPPVRRGTTKLGPITILGGETKGRFKEALVTFQHGKQKAVFSMIDIALVVKNAL